MPENQHDHYDTEIISGGTHKAIVTNDKILARKTKFIKFAALFALGQTALLAVFALQLSAHDINDEDTICTNYIQNEETGTKFPVCIENPK